MSDGTSTQEQTQQQTQQQQQSTPPQGNQSPPTPTAPPHGQQSSSGYGPGQQILDALNSLPEKIVNGLRESMQPPKVPSGTHTQSPDSEKSSAATGSGGQASQASNAQSATAPKGSSKQDNSSHSEPGKKTFAQWWFGG